MRKWLAVTMLAVLTVMLVPAPGQAVVPDDPLVTGQVDVMEYVQVQITNADILTGLIFVGATAAASDVPMTTERVSSAAVSEVTVHRPPNPRASADSFNYDAGLQRALALTERLQVYRE